ncbi:MAG: lamin tail domain-containing protein, partial [Myxococcota bacterium]|nr:lamin tail domain-containing protein [Myxococcota bacterium]
MNLHVWTVLVLTGLVCVGCGSDEGTNNFSLAGRSDVQIGPPAGQNAGTVTPIVPVGEEGETDGQTVDAGPMDAPNTRPENTDDRQMGETAGRIADAMPMAPTGGAVAGAPSPSDTQFMCPVASPLIVNEFLVDPPREPLGDANGDGVFDTTEDEFIEFVNASPEPLDISGYRLYDTAGLGNERPVHVFPNNTVLAPWSALVVFGGGMPTGEFGGALVQTAQSMKLSLNNDEDVITVQDANQCQILVFAYGAEIEGTRQSDRSATRAPDIVGGWTSHRDASPTGALFSPGTMVDGMAFGDPPPMVPIAGMMSGGMMSGGVMSGGDMAGEAEAETAGAEGGDNGTVVPVDCVSPLPLVINEFHSAPNNDLSGDANADGV